MKIYERKGKALQQGFGMTETGPLVTALDAGNASKKIGSTGMCALHTELRIVGENGDTLTEPKRSASCGSRPNVTPGYWNRRTPTRLLLPMVGYTGDAAYLDADGFLYIVDRWKDMYIWW